MSIIHLHEIVDEVFQDYYKTSMFLCAANCDGKCATDMGLPPSICSNVKLYNKPCKEYVISDIIERYLNNGITKAVVIGGLEPFLQPLELILLISEFRKKSDDDIVIYTGYNKDEISEGLINELKLYTNIIIKFGRYIPNVDSVYDNVLKVTLASYNQYAERIS